MAERMSEFFDVEERLQELSAKGDDLERIKALVDFEIFRPALEAAVSRADCSKGGRPPFDHVLMFALQSNIRWCSDHLELHARNCEVIRILFVPDACECEI